MSRFSSLLALACGLALPGTAFAQSETSASLNVGASAGGSSNPFSGLGGAAGYVELNANPTVQIRSARNTINLAANVEVQQYFERYSTRDNYTATADYTGRWSDRLTATASANYSNAISGSAFSGLATTPADPTNPTLPVIGTDLGLYGTGNRLSSITGQVGLAMRFSSLDSINLFGNLATTRNSMGGAAIDYDSYGGGFSYQRRLSERVSLGATGSVNSTDYRGGGNNLVYTGEVTFDVRVSERWTLNGGIGASRLSVSGASGLIGRARPQTTLSGHATFCRTLPSGPICLSADRSILPSSFGGARVQTSLTGTYNARMTERSSINLNAGYTQVGAGVTDNSTIQQLSAYRYYSGSVGLDHRFRQRLHGTASTYYRKIDGGSLNQSDDFGGQIGLTYNIGKVR